MIFLNMDYIPITTVSILFFTFRIDKIQKPKSCSCRKKKNIIKRSGCDGRLMKNNKEVSKI